MKKVLSIVLLLLFLFNVGGYYIVFWGLRYETDRQLTFKLDANEYDPSEIIEIKIPMVLPYPIQTQDFERVDGRFEHNGQHFKLVKQKLQHDTLYVICIRDHETGKLMDTMNDYVQRTQPIPGNESSQDALHYLSKLIKDFYSQSAVSVVHQYGYSTEVVFAELRKRFFQRIIPVPAPPPRY